ncbi:hypothetical protein E2C01_043813 [Portunus trituberculatus]|uniref:Uncharacterized protein n=1 Tax=Portunus trituberculatus TaxID=210409 RepID=A0A5B7G0I7_PORTR|nr:hypothetical protein [Portunus trituberculatus]
MPTDRGAAGAAAASGTPHPAGTLSGKFDAAWSGEEDALTWAAEHTANRHSSTSNVLRTGNIRPSIPCPSGGRVAGGRESRIPAERRDQSCVSRAAGSAGIGGARYTGDAEESGLGNPIAGPRVPYAPPDPLQFFPAGGLQDTTGGYPDHPGLGRWVASWWDSIVGNLSRQDSTCPRRFVASGCAARREARHRLPAGGASALR